MKIGRLSSIIFFIMFTSLLYMLSLAYFDIQLSLLFVMYFLFFEGILIFVFTVAIVVRNRSSRS